MRVARAEDLIIYKVVVDLARIRRTVAEFAQAMEEPERVAELDLIVRRVGLA